MRTYEQKLNHFRSIFFLCIALGLFSCSAARHVEKKGNNKVYNNFGLNKERKDNAALYREAASWLYVPHVDGGTSRNGTDCSFLVHQIYKTVYHKTLERHSGGMLNKNCKRIPKSRLKEGDLVFFDTLGTSGSNVSHVGIYLKDNKFLHTSTSKGVIVSDLDEAYYRKTWVSGGRVK
jgi:cell wall-associated NlpC family hydrolase